MRRGELVTLNMREFDRLKMVQAIVEMGLKPGRAAEKLGVTLRQIERLVIRYRESGAAGLTSRKRGRAGNRLGGWLRGISTIEAANADVPAFIAAYNARFAKPPDSTSARRN